MKTKVSAFFRFFGEMMTADTWEVPSRVFCASLNTIEPIVANDVSRKQVGQFLRLVIRTLTIHTTGCWDIYQMTTLLDSSRSWYVH